jgi:ADP-ribose pyrophosphatase YjhB (NUDIX family)
MEPGETVREAARREVKEESGADCEITGLVGIYSNPRHVAAYDDGEVRQEFSICLMGLLVGGSLQTSNESSEVKFVPVADLSSYEIHLSIRMRIGHYLEGQANPYIS